MIVKYGLLGHPLGHSFSKKFHNERFQRLGIDATYENYDLADVENLLPILVTNNDLHGLNVTIPYKQAIIPFLDDIDPLAKRIGAVNVVKIKHLKEDDPLYEITKVKGLFLKGFNSDFIGFTNSIKPMLSSENKKALILGTGGASKAIFVALQELGIESVFVSRTKKVDCLTYEELSKEILEEYTIIVNCSPVGMFPHVDECPAIPYEYITDKHVCFDAVYNPDVTMFMRKAQEHGAKVKCGYEMLVGQAIASYDIWTKE